MIERKIVIGLIVNDLYIRQITPIWDSKLMESQAAKLIAEWCIEYYRKYKKAPGQQIETIFFQKIKENLIDKVLAEEIELDILPQLSNEYENETDFDFEFLFNETVKHWQAVKLKQVGKQINDLIENGRGSLEERITTAENKIKSFKSISNEQNKVLDLSNLRSLKKSISKAFEISENHVINLPKAAGLFLNSSMNAGDFVAFMAPEKRGKTFLMMELALNAVRNGKNVIFFQAGDMNESSMLKRIAVNLSGLNYREDKCNKYYRTCRDCILNQINQCTKDERECDFGCFEGLDNKEIHELTKTDLIDSYEINTEYKPCYNCKEYLNDYKKLGSVWLEQVPKSKTLTEKIAVRTINKFMKRYKKHFKLDTYAKGTLSVKKIESKLDELFDAEEFVPDLIVIDYADLLSADTKEFRHGQNEIWGDLRKLSQTPRNHVMPLVITATQTDANSYKTSLLSMDNYSEDKRKFAHVTAMFGLNQSPNGREKSLGILRINQIIVREDESNIKNQVTILQDLNKAKAIRQSYF